MVTVIDGKNAILGRLGTVVAQKIMAGEDVVVLNCESIVITGEKEMVFADYKARFDRGECKSRKGPFYPRRADLLFKRSVRGMIPWTTTSGRNAFRRLHAYVGTPKQFTEGFEVTVEEQAMKKITGKYTTLGAVAKFLGSKIW
ncbi:MAG: 50S ribosomal protein L13 [Candidatus Methanomethylophilaceae archaeon]|jgi:large subunit ribosomal protein L13|nr:50S ribosomal protein L13 [Candidatus Methanomethylophilaceae archaeon]MBO5669515.1 50S ribosomal protein L13 [Candidatus Methanomethylophilaceae archaeon]MBO7205205.1 50S ribosomal protein L13 [Candidatus Methanomethylophilaceae archaeon]